MKTTPWRDLKHKASSEDVETVQREAVAEAERLRIEELQKCTVVSARNIGSEAA